MMRCLAGDGEEKRGGHEKWDWGSGGIIAPGRPQLYIQGAEVHIEFWHAAVIKGRSKRYAESGGFYFRRENEDRFTI